MIECEVMPKGEQNDDCILNVYISVYLIEIAISLIFLKLSQTILNTFQNIEVSFRGVNSMQRESNLYISK